MTKIEILEYIKSFSHLQLKGEALEYLVDKRGLSRDIIEQFELGYFPGFEKKFLNKVDKQEFKSYNLLYDNGASPLDGRITFPFYDHYGDLVAIVGRVFSKENNRKYWHNPFSKGLYLYGLSNSKKHIREKQTVYVCEGQIDLLTAYRFGIKNIVCSSGTALTPYQIALLSRYAKEICIIFDSDIAGQKATKKIFEKKRAGVELKAIKLPDGEDLDSSLCKYGKNVLEDKKRETNTTEELEEYVARLG